MKVCIDGIVQEVKAPENELIIQPPVSIEEELADIKSGINRLADMLSAFIKK